jgi:CBS-domain-containing membrane protein
MVKVAMLHTLRVKDVMTEAILLLRAEMPVDDAWSLLHDGGVNGAPVLDARGRLVGVLSNSDLADPRRRYPDASGTVGDLMTRVVYAVRADDPVLTAVRLMADENIHRAVVVNDDGTLAGIVVPMDILRVLARDAEARGADAHVEYVDLRRMQGGPVPVTTLPGNRETLPTAIVFESMRAGRGLR